MLGERLLSLLCALPVLWLADARAEAQRVHVPVPLDYPFIRAVLVQQAFTLPGERAVVLDQDEGCATIELWSPEVSSEGQRLKVGSHVKVRAGVPLLGKCVQLAEWEGYIELLQRVWLDEAASRLRFQTVDSRVYSTAREPATIASAIWSLIKSHLHVYLNRVYVDLGEPLQALKGLLPLFFSPAARERVERWADTVAFTAPRVGADAVRVDLVMDVETQPASQPVPEELSQAEIQRLTRSWEDWDAYLAYELKSLVGKPITEGERRTIVETLLETRQAFVRALSERALRQDLVRVQFIWAWERLAPILRRYLGRQASPSLFTRLAFFTATDALAALDKMGPAVGLEVSRDGLIRLARLLMREGAEPSLDYSFEVSPELRGLLGLGPPLDESGPSFDIEELEIPGEPGGQRPSDDQGSLLKRGPPVTRAEEAPPSRLADILPWLPPARDAAPYLGKVRQVLEEAAGAIQGRLDVQYRRPYATLVLATAWQESCWRQFVRAGQKVRYLLSWSGTSVGLMQINERVWRGIYRPEHLRWNIRYNAHAGSEILALYLREGAVKRTEPQSLQDADVLVRAVYAMYNGGPGQLNEFLKRSQRNAFTRLDDLFWQKYALVRRDRLDELITCITGD